MTEAQTIDGPALRSEWALPGLSDEGTKHDRGTIAVIGGAAATPGAIILAGLAALRVGAGRLSMATVRANATAVAVAVPESAVIGLPTTPDGAIAAAAAEKCRQLVEQADAVLLGPGMESPTDTRRLVEELLPHVGENTVVVLDALALTCGVTSSEALAKISTRVVLTPNKEEAQRILDNDRADPDETGMATALAERLGAVTLLGSTIASPDGRCYRTPKGNIGLATSGSGDVLAGIVAGLAARGAEPVRAALWGVSLHSGAGDRLVHRVGSVGYLARELLDELPQLLADHQ